MSKNVIRDIVSIILLCVLIGFIAFWLNSCDNLRGPMGPQGADGIGNSLLDFRTYQLPMDVHIIRDKNVVYMEKWSSWRFETSSQWYIIDYIIEEVRYSANGGDRWVNISISNVEKYGIGKYIFLMDYGKTYLGCKIRIKVDYRVK